MIRENKSNVPVLTRIQCTYQYVSIIDTLRTLFENSEFSKLYFDFNDDKEKMCKNGTYQSFCCGDVYKLSNFFRENPYSIQIQIGHDDFSILNPLSSRAGCYKICGIYFTIRNLPQKFLSKFNNIFLIALVNSDDYRKKEVDFNDIWRRILVDLTFLENIGISVGDLQVKGTLI